MMNESGAEHVLGFRELSDFAQFLGQRIEETALRIRLQTEAQLLNFGRRRGLSHLPSKAEFLLIDGAFASCSDFAADENRPRSGGGSSALLRVK